MLKRFALAALLIIASLGLAVGPASPASAALASCHDSVVSPTQWGSTYLQAFYWPDGSIHYQNVRASSRLQTGPATSACAGDIYFRSAQTGPNYNSPCDEMNISLQLQVGSSYGAPYPVGGNTFFTGFDYAVAGDNGGRGDLLDNSPPGVNPNSGYRFLLWQTTAGPGPWGYSCYSPTLRTRD